MVNITSTSNRYTTGTVISFEQVRLIPRYIFIGTDYLQAQTMSLYAMPMSLHRRWVPAVCPRVTVSRPISMPPTAVVKVVSSVYIGMALEPPITSVIAQRDPTEHARRRRPWTRAFSTAALKEYEPIIRKRITQLGEAIASEKGTTDLSRWFSYFT